MAKHSRLFLFVLFLHLLPKVIALLQLPITIHSLLEVARCRKCTNKSNLATVFSYSFPTKVDNDNLISLSRDEFLHKKKLVET